MPSLLEVPNTMPQRLSKFIDRFKILKKSGVDIQVCFDIGAYRGAFTEDVKDVFPLCYSFLFEADERQAKYMPVVPEGCEVYCLLLGNENKKVKFYTLAEDTCTTGSSIYCERTIFYSKPLVLDKDMITLDSWYNLHEVVKRFDSCWRQNGLVKIDTQGSELDILCGADLFLKKNRPKYILLEVSVCQYNQGSPLVVEVFRYMSSLGYAMKDLFDFSYTNDGGVLLAMDILFEAQ